MRCHLTRPITGKDRDGSDFGRNGEWPCDLYQHNAPIYNMSAKDHTSGCWVGPQASRWTQSISRLLSLAQQSVHEDGAPGALAWAASGNHAVLGSSLAVHKRHLTLRSLCGTVRGEAARSAAHPH